VISLAGFDAFGVRALRLRLRGERHEPAGLAIRGAYRYVRHPLYLFVLLLIWSAPQMSADRLLFNVLWTAWIVIGARLEERDLVGEFGDAYRDYQRRVPMLVPWRRPAAKSP
jgi:protein-S-isoprenylcysteine O-methyltransferase Ste14